LFKKGIKEEELSFLFVACFSWKDTSNILQIAGLNRLVGGRARTGADLEGSYEGCVYIFGGGHLIQQQS